MLRVHAFPRAFSKRFNELDDVVRVEMKDLLNNIDALDGGVVDAKPLILHSAANIFTSYFCSRSFDYSDEDFRRMVANFDEIFYEINQGYLADFIPWLMPFHKRHLDRVSDWSHSIRDFVTKEIVADRLDSWVPGTQQLDYVDCLVDHVKNEKQQGMSWDSALFALEDIVGGHSAIGNLLVKVSSASLRFCRLMVRRPLTVVVRRCWRTWCCGQTCRSASVRRRSAPRRRRARASVWAPGRCFHTRRPSSSRPCVSSRRPSSRGWPVSKAPSQVRHKPTSPSEPGLN